MMCGDPISVFATDRGLVLQCPDCLRLSVTFNNTMFNIDRADLDELRRIVGAFDSRWNIRVLHSGLETPDPPLILQGKDPGMAFVFRGNEIAELRALLEGTALLLEIAAQGRISPS